MWHWLCSALDSGGSSRDKDDADDNLSTRGSADSDTIGGGASNATLRGEGGDDLLSGFAGNDRLFGGDGADTLIGGLGADQLSGGDGDDRLVGAAADTLRGDDGADGFAFDTRERSAGVVTVSDFDPATDGLEIVAAQGAAAPVVTLCAAATGTKVLLNGADATLLGNVLPGAVNLSAITVSQACVGRRPLSHAPQRPYDPGGILACIGRGTSP